MGQALATDGRRDKVFLMSKVCGRDYKSAMSNLEDSLRRMKTDRIDLWQFHGMKHDDDASLIFDEEKGAMKAAREAVKAGKVRFLGFSEIEIYDHLVDVTERPGEFARIAAFFRRVADAVAAEVERVRPDVVWTCAFQQGHPEHDLAHVCAALATRALRPDATFCQLPQYELTILVPLRFAPWFRGEVQEIRLTPEELAAKYRMRDAYPSQVELFARFKRVIDGLGRVGAVAGRGFSFEEFASRETFAVVPPEHDYLRSTHPVEALNYMRDSHRGVKVRFDRHVRPIVTALLAGDPAAGAAARAV